MTSTDLENLKRAYYRGVLRVREGNSWVEYKSGDEQWQAILRLEAELNPTSKVKTQYVSVSKGYNR